MAPQQLLDGHSVRLVPIRPIAEAGQDWRQVLNPDRPRLRFVVQEGGLIGHVDINRNTSLRDYGLGAAEMVRVDPDIIVVEGAEIGCVGFRGAAVAREAASMGLGAEG